jgi:N,N'-diacetyllegionaminate synthase
MMLPGRTVQIGSKSIGPGQPVYVVFEAGPTHSGIATAKQLVDVAVNAGADAVKFQILDADKMVSSGDVMFTYTRLVDKETGRTEDVCEPLRDILRRRQLEPRKWREIIGYCRQQGIEFFSTATNEEELGFLVDNNIQTVKICSGDVNYFHLIRRAARCNLSLQLDTGSSSLGEVEAAVAVAEREGNENIILNHCPSGYPARLDGINLRVITTLKQIFRYPVAFSDHSTGFVMDVAAVALGATMIEKTITLDRTSRSPEHIMSLEPSEAEAFVRTIRDLEIALGVNRRLVTPDEEERRLVTRRSIFAASDLKAGAVVTQDMLKYMRPGDGIPADMDVYVIGRRLRRDVPEDHKLSLADLE